MAQDDLDNFGAYRKSRELFDLVEDMRQIENVPACWKLIGQQVASADSICANMEEGYGRWSPKEYVQFLLYSRGSARETRGRYERLAHWLPGETVTSRVALCDEIIAILTASIRRLRENPVPRPSRSPRPASRVSAPSSPVPRPS
jgi:four helix bundle protein